MFYTVTIRFGLSRFDGEPIPDDEAEAAQLYGLIVLTKLLGGGEEGNRVGSCIGPSGLMIEACCVLTADAEEVDNNCFEKLDTLASELAELLDQRSVQLKVQKCEGELRYVRPRAASAKQKDHLRNLLTLLKLSSLS